MISCKCITYGRVDTLEESLEAFLRQDYQGEKELVIVNDYPLQKLEFDHPEVRIFNLDETFQTIGEKENFAVEQCKGDIIAVWDDDDIALPNHLSNIATEIENCDLLHWKKGLYMGTKDKVEEAWIGNSGMVYTKKIWESVGRHAKENAGYDKTFVDLVGAIGKIKHAEPKKPSWIYIWADRSYHMSGMGTDDDTRENVIVRHSEHIEGLRKEGKIPTGIITLNPHWKQDYISMVP